MDKNNQEMKDIPSHRVIVVKLLKATSTRGERIVLMENAAKQYSYTDHIVLPLDYRFNTIREQALDHLISIGFKPVCTADDGDQYIIMCDNWTPNFIELRT